MARNRKNESSVVRFGPIIKAFLLCLLIGGVGVGYVQQQNQLHVLANQRKQREIRLDRLRHDNERRQRDLDILQTPAKIEERIKQMNLGLVQPEPNQIVRLSDRIGDPASDNQIALYAGRTTLDPKRR